MRAALQCLLTTTVVLAQEPTFAAGLQSGPNWRDSISASEPILITPADRVRIQTVADPDRVPALLRGQFAASLAGVNQNTLTVVLDSGQPAVLHRDLVSQLEVRVDHGSGWKHALVGAGIGAAAGALIGFAHGDDPQGEFMAFSAGDYAAMTAILLMPIGAVFGALLPSGESWNVVPVESVQWTPTPGGAPASVPQPQR